MRKLTLCATLLLILPGCTAEFNWPANLPQHLSFTWTGVTISWPVILGIVLAIWLIREVKRLIRNASKKNNGQED